MLPTAKHNLLPCFKSVRSHWLIDRFLVGELENVTTKGTVF